MANTLNNRHTKIFEWLKTCESISALHFLQGEWNEKREIELNNQVVFFPESNSLKNSTQTKKSYIDGSKEVLYTFYLTQYVPLISQAGTTDNIEAINAFDGVAEWLDLQIKNNNLPKLDNGETIRQMKMSPISTVGQNEKGTAIRFSIETTIFIKY